MSRRALSDEPGAPPFRAIDARDTASLSPAERLALRLTSWTPASWRPIRRASLDWTPWARPGQIVVDSFGGFCEVIDE